MESEWLGTLREQLRERRDPWVILEGSAAVEAAIGGWWEVPGVVAAEDTQWQAPVWSGLDLLRLPLPDEPEIADFVLHFGVVGLAKIPQETGEVAKFLAGLEPNALVVVCPRLNEAADAGAIMRNAAAMGAAGILFSAEGVSPFERAAVRASAGAVFRLPVRVGDGGLLLRSLKAAKFEMLAALAGEGAEDVRELPPATGRRALVLSSEEGGLGAFWSAGCDRKVKIPMNEASVDSLGLVACSAVLLWELVRGLEEK
jgi:TrmH family RNA methyltransferase